MKPDEFVMADERLRRNATLVLAILLPCLFLLFLWGVPTLIDFVHHKATPVQREVIIGLWLAGNVPLLIGGLYLLSMGRLILRKQQFPPPRVRLVWTLKVRRGAAARPFGIGVGAIGGFVLVAALLSSTIFLVAIH